MRLKRFYLRYYPPGLGICTVADDQQPGDSDGGGSAEHVRMVDLLDFSAE